MKFCNHYQQNKTEYVRNNDSAIKK